MRAGDVFPIPTRRVSAGADIVREGDEAPSYLLILQGWAAPYKCLGDGRRQFFDILIGFDGFRGLRSSYDRRASLNVAALTDCSVWQGTRDDLRTLNEIRGGYGFDECQSIFVEQHQRTLNRMTVLGHTRAPQRVAYCLYELWKRQLGNRAAAGASCPLPITQTDIGDAVGLTGVHVCRTISTFKSRKILTIEDGRLTVHRPVDLEAIAGVGPVTNLR